MGLRRLARWIGSSDFKTHEEFCSKHQLLRYSTHQAAREQRPRRSRNELCNSGAAEQPEGAHGSRIGLFNESFKQGASR